MENLTPNLILPSDMRRVVGTEMEHGNRSTRVNREHRTYTDGIIADAFKIYMDPKITGHLDFLSTGDRAYQDVGRHFEFSTAETFNFWEAVEREFYGGQLIVNALTAAKEDGYIVDFDIEKIVSNGLNFWGYHENYLGPANLKKYDDYLLPLALHLATRQVFAGAGDLQSDGQFHVSQKMRSTKTLWNGRASNSGTRPLVDINRDEHHADAIKYNRHHITSGDPHLQKFPAWLQLVTTSIVMRMVEAGVDLRDLYLADPVAAALEVDLDTDLTTKLTLENGRQLTALEIQRRLALRAYYVSQKIPFTDEELVSIKEWLDITDDLKYRTDKCEDRVEWIAKKQFIDSVKDVKGDKATNQGLANLALKWTNLDKEKGYGLRFEHLRRPIPFGSPIDDYSLPPESNRAQLRGRLIGAVAPHIIDEYNESKNPIYFPVMDWSRQKVSGRATGSMSGQVIWMRDPYSNENEDAEKVIDLANNL